MVRFGGCGRGWNKSQINQGNEGNCCRCPMHKFCLCIKGSLSGEISCSGLVDVIEG